MRCLLGLTPLFWGVGVWGGVGWWERAKQQSLRKAFVVTDSFSLSLSLSPHPFEVASKAIGQEFDINDAFFVDSFPIQRLFSSPPPPPLSPLSWVPGFGGYRSIDIFLPFPFRRIHFLHFFLSGKRSLSRPKPGLNLDRRGRGRRVYEWPSEKGFFFFNCPFLGIYIVHALSPWGWGFFLGWWVL